MAGRLLAGGIVVIALLMGGGIYYAQVYGYYAEVAGAEVEMISLVTGEAEVIAADNVRAIDADSSPIRYRACFTTEMSQALLTETYEAYESAEPLIAPGWFECFDAVALGEALEEGRALAFLGQSNVTFGIDRVVAVDGDGRGYVWHQINECGREVFDGRALPEGCPSREGN
ncbi:DUF6446 family protein [Actibacterium sp. 188UL27-1]|uniref:DUF6446 family protein n=1 Tax=Actibacterium sp. 188UL27-1 TaxID=2786961 RepID=UPI00195EB6B4|nr:DUF6446 family protein [Actibacterium sp. 188UL27-1]MBM7068755.1 histidine kinase [Actibacterium sp. 188UL27-1]